VQNSARPKEPVTKSSDINKYQQIDQLSFKSFHSKDIQKFTWNFHNINVWGSFQSPTVMQVIKLIANVQYYCKYTYLQQSTNQECQLNYVAIIKHKKNFLAV